MEHHCLWTTGQEGPLTRRPPPGYEAGGSWRDTERLRERAAHQSIECRVKEWPAEGPLVHESGQYYDK